MEPEAAPCIFTSTFSVRPSIVLAQVNQNFFTTEMVNNLGTLGKGLTQFGAGEDDAIFLAMVTGTQRGHTVTLVAVEGPVDFHRFAEQIFGGIAGYGDAIKDLLSLEQTVEIANTGMVTTDQHVVDAVVLTEGGMEESFARTGITHIQRITGADDVLFDEVFVDQDIDSLDHVQEQEYRRP